MKTTVKQKMDSTSNAVYTALDGIFGHIPKPLLYICEISGSVFTFIGLSDVELPLRIAIGVLTLLMLTYSILSLRSNIAANKRKETLDNLQIEKTRLELETLRNKLNTP
jgi:hypothetical protein